MVLSACGGASKTHSSAAAPAAMPIAPQPVAQSPATSPPATPDQPKPTEPEKVAIAEDPDAGGEIADDPDAGGEATGSSSGMGGLGTRGSGAGGGGIGTGAGMGTGQGYGAGAPGLRSREPAQPSLRWGMPTVKGELDKDIVRRVFRRHQNELRYCYEMQLTRNPKLQGLLVVKLVIDADGKVTSASSSGVHKDVEACVTNRAKTWLFPKPAKGIVTVSHPITFVLP